MPETVDSDRMVTLWITEYMLNTAGYAYQRAGFLQYNLTNDDVSRALVEGNLVDNRLSRDPP